MVGLRRRQNDRDGQDEDQDSAERHHIRVKKEDGGGGAHGSAHTAHTATNAHTGQTGRLPGGIIKNVTVVADVMENT